MSSIELGERKKQVLRMIIETYIRTGEPIGSKAIVEQLDNAVSSATIRNDMAELSQLGLLEQPHTSAGRIPTASAFRIYIDSLMPHHDLDENGRREIDERLHSMVRTPEKLLDMASRALADITHCAAVTTTPWERDATLKRVELFPMTDTLVTMILLTASGIVRSRVVHIGRPLTVSVLLALSEQLKHRFVGLPLTDIGAADVQSVMTAMGDNGLRCAPLLTAFMELASEAMHFELQTAGQIHLLRRSDLTQEHTCGIFQFLTQRDLLVPMLVAHTGNLRVMLGEECSRPELIGSGIIVARYAGGNGVGSIGLIGPLRMDYAHVIPRVEYFAGRFGKLLSECMEDEGQWTNIR